MTLGGITAVEPDMIGEALLLDVWREDNIQALPAITRAYATDPDAVAKTVSSHLPGLCYPR